jgi:hypothetical protein
MSTRRPIVTHAPMKSRGEIQNLVTYHTKRRDAIENHLEKEKGHLFSGYIRTSARLKAGST